MSVMAKSLSNLGKIAKFKAGRAVRKAGDKLRSVDDNYSKAIVDMYIGKEGDERSYADNPLLGTAAGVASVFAGGTPLSGMSGSSLEKGAAITSALAKYGAPLAGVGLATKGAYDMAVALGSGEQTPGTVMP